MKRTELGCIALWLHASEFAMCALNITARWFAAKQLFLDLSPRFETANQWNDDLMRISPADLFITDAIIYILGENDFKTNAWVKTNMLPTWNAG